MNRLSYLTKLQRIEYALLDCSKNQTTVIALLHKISIKDQKEIIFE